MFFVIKHHGKVKIEADTQGVKTIRREALKEGGGTEVIINEKYREIVNSHTMKEE